MPHALLVALVLAAAILIVFGRVNHRARYGTLVALCGYAVLAAAAVIAIVGR